jgi:hypothetical protein
MILGHHPLLVEVVVGTVIDLWWAEVGPPI